MRKRMVILFCCMGIITLLVSGCGDDSKEAAMSENSKSTVSLKENASEENSVSNIEVYVSDWTLDDYLCASLADRMTVKKEITVSNEKSYFALVSFGGDTRIMPIPDGKGKITEEINNKNDFPSKFEIGALFEMKSLDNSGLEISLGNIKNEISEYDSLRDSVYVSAKVTEKSKKSFILFYQIINKKSEIVDYGYRVIENGKGEIWKSITPLETDEYSVQINGVYVIDGNDTDILKVNKDYEWTKSDLDGYYEASQKVTCITNNCYGIGAAKEIINGKNSGIAYFYVYDGVGEIEFAEKYEKSPKYDENFLSKNELDEFEDALDDIGEDYLSEDELVAYKEYLKNYFPKYSYKITAFSHDCIKPDLYTIEYADAKFAKNITDEMDREINRKIKKEPAIGMTAEQVEASTWGKPKDINKTTYSWGVKEQWVYSDYRYIYLEDGIVTAIQE